MPRAVSTIETEKVDLKSCPGGYVMLRNMTYGQFLHRQEMMMNMQVSGGKGTMSGEMKMNGKSVAGYEFAICIAEHNLTDENDQPLDFKRAATLELLDPRVGQEIGAAIDKLNKFDEEQAPN